MIETSMFESLIIWIPLGLIMVWFITFIATVILRWKEEKIYSQWKEEAGKIKNQPIAMEYIEGQLGNLDKEYKSEIENLERQRQFIRDIMPFIKK